MSVTPITIMSSGGTLEFVVPMPSQRVLMNLQAVLKRSYEPGALYAVFLRLGPTIPMEKADKFLEGCEDYVIVNYDLSRVGFACGEVSASVSFGELVQPETLRA